MTVESAATSCWSCSRQTKSLPAVVRRHAGDGVPRFPIHELRFNDLRFSHHVQHPVRKQGRPVPNQRNGQSECLRNTRSRRWKTPCYRGKTKTILDSISSVKERGSHGALRSQLMRNIENGQITKSGS